MPTPQRFVQRTLLLLSLALSLGGCAVLSPTSPQLPKPPSALMESETQPSGDYLLKALNWFKKATSELEALQQKSEGCKATSPKSAECS